MGTIASITGAEFDALPYEEGRQWELLDGVLIPVASPTPRHQDIVFLILLTIRQYLQSGRVVGKAYQDVDFAISESDRLRPDVGVVLGAKATSLDRDKVPIPYAPDIAIEVISPSERATDSYDKVRAYLRSGTKEVWQFYPNSQTLVRHKGDTSISLECASHLETDLLPGFSLMISTLFD